MRKKSKHKMKKRSKVIIDTNVISQGVGDRAKPQLDAVRIADHKKVHVYTKEVDDELAAIKPKKDIRHIPSFFDNINRYRKKKRKKIVDSHSPPHEQLDLPADKKDKRILYAAIKNKVDTIVTMDKNFKSKANGHNGIKLIFPDEYVERQKALPALGLE